MEFIMVEQKVHNVELYRPPVGTLVNNPGVAEELRTTQEKPYVIRELNGVEHALSMAEAHSKCCISTFLLEVMSEPPKKLVAHCDQKVYWAKLVPIQEGEFEGTDEFGYAVKGNCAGLEHGWGDVIIAPDDDGKPAEDGRFVVNGLLFVGAYQAKLQCEPEK